MPTASGYKTVFVIGCPRSGTTWMQLLLSRFSSVATAPETQIFAYYFDHFVRQWKHEHDAATRFDQGQAGLSRVLSQGDFEEVCRRGAMVVLDKIHATNPAASVVCEKSPRHALQAEFIRRIFPDAYFLHVIRDPRDTVASLMAAARSWGSDWAPRSAIRAARMWEDHIRAARRVSDNPHRYREIRYEALQANPVEELSSILSWLAVPGDRPACEQAVAECDLGKLQKSADGRQMPLPGEKSPKGFFRKGKVGGWQEDLSRADVRVIEHICASFMAEFGYEPITRWGVTPPLRIPVHDSLQRVRESIDWQIAKVLDRV